MLSHPMSSGLDDRHRHLELHDDGLGCRQQFRMLIQHSNVDGRIRLSQDDDAVLAIVLDRDECLACPQVLVLDDTIGIHPGGLQILEQFPAEIILAYRADHRRIHAHAPQGIRLIRPFAARHQLEAAAEDSFPWLGASRQIDDAVHIQTAYY